MLTIGANDALRREDLPFTFGTWVWWVLAALVRAIDVPLVLAGWGVWIGAALFGGCGVVARVGTFTGLLLVIG